jgi:hypothetical protein
MEIAVIFHIVGGGRPQRPSKDECLLEMGDSMWGLIESCWKHDPAGRPSMGEVEGNLLQMTDPERTMKRQSSGSSKHRLSHRELVRLSVAIPAIPPHALVPTPPSTPPLRPRSPSIHSLLRATPTANISFQFHMAPGAEVEPNEDEIDSSQEILHVRTGAHVDSDAEPSPSSSASNDRIAAILNVLDDVLPRAEDDSKSRPTSTSLPQTVRASTSTTVTVCPDELPHILTLVFRH